MLLDLPHILCQPAVPQDSMEPPVQSPMASAASSSAFSFSFVSSALSLRSMSSCVAWFSAQQGR